MTQVLSHISGWLLSLVGGEEELAEEEEAGASVDGALDLLELADGAFDLAAAPGQGQAVADGVVVLADAAGEGGELGDAAGLRGLQPCLKGFLAGGGLDGGGDAPGGDVAEGA